MAKITHIWAREILDSRGTPTIECACRLDTGHITVASVPSGASKGTHEAVEVRDEDSSRYLGMGALTAVSNVNNILGPSVLGMDPVQQESIDEKLIKLDGTEDKSRYGSNSILAISVVVSKAAALSFNIPLYEWIAKLAEKNGLKPRIHVPTLIMNIINGGLHGAGNLDFQEFQIITATSKTYRDSLRMGSEIYSSLGDTLARRGAIHSIGDEGGYAPNLSTNADALEIIVEAIKNTNYTLGRDVFLGLDVAASTFYKNGEYNLRDKTTPMKEDDLVDYYNNLNNRYRLATLEDPFYEDAWDGWKKLKKSLYGHVTLVGDDLLVTNPNRVEKAIKEDACGAILIKPNQAGTITETIKVIKKSINAGWKVVVSHRSGETNDWFIADFAVGMGADYVKFGAPARGERIAKYNRLLSIDSELSAKQNVPVRTK
jgi:enolase